VAGQIAGIVDNAAHLEHAFIAAAIEERMPRLLYALALHSAPAELKRWQVRAPSIMISGRFVDPGRSGSAPISRKVCLMSAL
jgi:hypothetical protein